MKVDFYCTLFSKLYGLNYSIVRLSNSYGPYDPPGNFRNVIPNFIDSALKEKDIIITGNGNETRDFTFIDDTVNGILLATVKSKGKNQTFNLGTGKETKIKNIAKLILKYTHSNSKIIYKPKRAFDPINRRRMNITKAQNLLKYSPKISIDFGLQKTCNWIMKK